METAHKYTFPKSEHLCREKEIEALFAGGETFMRYPYRITFKECEREAVSAKVMVVVQKKKFKKAVERVAARRQMREAYRLNKHIVCDTANERHTTLRIAFVYIGTKIEPWEFNQKRMCEALGKIRNRISNGGEKGNRILD